MLAEISYLVGQPMMLSVECLRSLMLNEMCYKVILESKELCLTMSKAFENSNPITIVLLQVLIDCVHV